MQIGEYIKTVDRLKLYIRQWQPEGLPKGVIVLVHGLGEHIERYDSWALRFNKIGWAVIGHDLRGHGHSDGKRGNGSYQSHLNNIDTVVRIAKKRYGNIPRILYGHSMGGNLALGYVISRLTSLDGLIVTSPWLWLTNPPISPLVRFARLLLRIYPGILVPNGLNNRHLSRDPEVYRELMKDPLAHNKISISTFFQVQEWANIILKNKHKINVPLLLLHGNNDRITSWKGTFMLAQETSDNTHIRIWADGYHELHNDICKEEVFDYLANWIEHNFEENDSCQLKYSGPSFHYRQVEKK